MFVGPAHLLVGPHQRAVGEDQRGRAWGEGQRGLAGTGGEGHDRRAVGDQTRAHYFATG